MFIATFALSALLALVFAFAGGSKVAGNAKLLEGGAHLGYSAGSYKVIGGLEAAGGAGLLIGLWLAPLGVAAATGLVLMMAGAVISHARVKDPVAETAAPLVLGLVTAAALVLRIVTA